MIKYLVSLVHLWFSWHSEIDDWVAVCLDTGGANRHEAVVVKFPLKLKLPVPSISAKCIVLNIILEFYKKREGLKFD